MSDQRLPWTLGPAVSATEYDATITDRDGAIVASTYHEHAQLLLRAPLLLRELKTLERLWRAYGSCMIPERELDIETALIAARTTIALAEEP